MSNNKQDSLDYYITKLTEILGPEIIKQISRDDNERIARLEKQAKTMHKEEHENTWIDSRIEDKGNDYIGKQKSFNEYYNETYGNTNGN